MARAAAGDRPDDLLPRLRAYRPGKLVNATIWTILALRQAGEPAPPALVTRSSRAQRPTGGWSWLAGGAADANDTAAAIQALRAAGVHGAADRPRRRLPPPPPERGRRLRADARAAAPTRSRPPGRSRRCSPPAARPGTAAFRYLARMRRPDGSYRYNARYVTTPLWVTAQVLPALARKPFPLSRT